MDASIKMDKEKRIGIDVDSKREYRKTKLAEESSLDRHRSRRRTLVVSAGLAVPVAFNLPSKWRQPVIDTVLLPGHAQTSCTPLLRGSGGAGAADPCPVVVLSAGLEGAQASLLTPSGTVIPVLSLTGLQISGCCKLHRLHRFLCHCKAAWCHRLEILACHLCRQCRL